MSKYKKYRNLIKENHDLMLMLWIVVVYKISICFHISYLQIFLAPLVIYLIGFTFLIVLFSKKDDINNFQRFILSLFVGVAMLPVASLLSILVFRVVNIENLSTSILLLVFGCISVAIYRRSKATKEDIFTIEIRKLLNIKNINFLLILTIIFLIGMLIRVYPFINFSIFPGTWFAPNSFYHTLYTVQTGKLLNVGDVHTTTAFATTIYNFLSLKGFILFQTSFFLMFGLTNLQQMLLVNKYLPWVGALLLPLTALVVANKFEEKGEYKLLTKEYILIFLLGSFASFYTTYLTKRMCVALPYGWLFILLSIYTLMDEKIEYKILGLIFGFSVVWFYYTAASTYFIILVTILVLQLVFLRKEIISTNYILMYSTIYVGYLVYLAERFFHSYIRVLETLISQEHMEVITTISKYTAPISPTSLWHIIIYFNGMLIGIIYILFIYWKIKGKSKHPCSDKLLYIIIGLFTVTIVFFGWRGLKGAMGRMEQYTSIILLAVFPILLLESKSRSKFRKLLYSIAILVIFTSILGHILNDVMQPGYITYTEEYAIKWYAKFGNNERVFTDFRIGTAPFLLNCWEFTGIMTVPHKVKMEELQKLINIYYTNNATVAYNTLFKYYKPSFLLLSKEMSIRGVVTSSENFRPVSSHLFSVYDNSSFFDKVYDNGEVYYYKLKLLTKK